ncbi:translation initiation factor eIF-2B epsilon subunit, GEF [Coemansia pectinata]|uniref:Translation initiation factor eIF2B subunit epsilon n=1 Tax=Coemansia pectinata TaxID=1052879 RepID=A0A9W8LAL7_9FUNG|nr:translation initiation factor eIF-2B epsilon subunit, GEF [Coemansia pectinata]KAJ2876174.1 translation initiation factor eIF-2B epsilon subunit, GEF [Coemansia aciculifera]
MAPKKSIATKISEEKELKAVVLADSFDDLFQPLALNKPRCLLPLCNVPMIEYTLEFLAASGVSEAILICKSHSEKLLAYIRQSKWKRSSTPMKVNTTVAQSATSVCDALRNIDESRVITSDFILCTGLVVSNMNLSGLVAAHLANKSRDRNQIMTMLLREAASSHRLFDKSDESVYIIEPSTSRLLAVNTSPSLPRAQDVDIPTNAIIYKMPKVEPRAGFIDTNESVYSPEVELRADLIDTHVSICSPEVLSLLTENFDYQVMRRDFVHRTLASDLLSSTIYAHILTGSSSVLSEATSAAATATTPDALIPAVGALDLSAGGGITFASHSGYAAGVADTAAYDAISRDLIGRWAYPLCPDSNPIDGPPYSYHRGAVYKTPSVFLGRESRVDHHVILGPNSHVADHARVFDSVLGSGCRVSGQSVVHGSYLFDGASVGRGSVVEKSILGERVAILENVVIERGCLIGDDVVIGPNVRIAAFSRISRRAPQSSQVPANNEFDSYSEASDDSDVEESDDSDGANVARNKDHPVASHASTSGQSGQPSSAGIEVFDTQTLGASGVGYVWVDDAEADSDLEDDISDEELDSRIRILHSIGSNLNDVELANAELAAEDSVEQHEWQPESAFVQDSQEHFEYELILTINTVLEGRSTEMTITDIRTFRMTCNADQDRIRPIVLEEVLNAIDLAALPSSAKTTLAKAVQLIKWGINSGAEQIDAISIIERHCATNPTVDDDVRGRLFKVVVCVLYELDILEDLAIISWYNRSLKKPDGEVSRKLLDTIKAFADMLNESEDEDESDDEDSSSEE